MQSTRKLGLALALAAALVVGGAVVQVRADTAAATTCPPGQAHLCDIIARSIQYLKGIPNPGPLVQALLARLEALQARYCTTC